MKKIRYLAEWGVLAILFLVFKTISVETASNFGGWIGRNVGPRLAASRKAMINIKRAFPNKTQDEYNVILSNMWDNLGRVVAEYPHLKTIIENHLEVIGHENLKVLIDDKPCILIGAHLANWELLPFYSNLVLKRPFSSVYRAPNNPYVEKLLARCRDPEDKGVFIPKSKKGARDMVKTLQSGGRLGILIDQKYNEGIPAPFFDHPAMTSAAFAQLARKYQCPVLSGQIERIKGCNFRMTIHPPIFVKDESDYDIVLQSHHMMEGWITQNPGQWLWLHRRWG